MSLSRFRRAAMGLAGAGVTATGLLAVPSPGGAVAPATDLSVDTTITVPGDVRDAVEDVQGIVHPTTTTTSEPPTTTTSSTTTSTTTSSTTTTTTTTVPSEPAGEATEEVVETAEEVVQGADDVVVDQRQGPTVEELRDDYRRIGDPDYTPVFGKRSTAEVVELLDAVRAPFETRARVLAPFPVAGAAHYSDDWGAVRTNPAFHFHEGTDVFAERGTPVIAATSGTISRVSLGTAVGGNSVHLTTEDGTYYYYAHLDSVSPLVQEGLEVAAGVVLGTVGTSGNAAGTPPHLHFEIHPGGGGPVPPAPYLDAWLAAAHQEARALRTPSRAAVVDVPAPSPLPPAHRTRLAAFEGDPGGGVPGLTGLAVLVAPGVLFLATRRRKAASVIARLEERVRHENHRDAGGSQT